MTNDKTRLLTTDELESVFGGDYSPTPQCDTEEIKAGGVTVLKIPVYCWDWTL
jgi:hypothetical protein